MYPEHILKKLRQRWGLDEDDKSKDDVFNNYSPNEVLDEVCMWEGLIGYGPCIRGWIESIYGIDLE